MTLVIIGIDALDSGLVDYFDAGSFELNRSSEMETYANMKEDPYTPEVWATVATGLEPDEHGVTGEGTSEWGNPLLELASKFTGRLPQQTRARLGDIAEAFSGGEYTIGRTDAPSMFDDEGRVVHTWPGVASAENVLAMWSLMRENNIDGVPVAEFRRRAFGDGVQQFAWAREMLDYEVALAGTHVHTLDVLGHAFANDEEMFRSAYAKVGGWVDEVIDALGEGDDLLLLSDHGMRTSFYDDEKVGAHSFRAFASTTKEVPPPESVFEVRAWIEENIDVRVEADQGDVELPVEELRDLGYIN
jgi:predicted AlkP superfamily pyrophosphatase or phosphodiesterase